MWKLGTRSDSGSVKSWQREATKIPHFNGGEENRHADYEDDRM